MIDFIQSAVSGAYNAFCFGQEVLDRKAVVLRPFKISVQLDGYSCGLRTAEAILSYYRQGTRGLRKELGTTKDGTDQDQLRRLFRRRGLKMTRINLPTLAKLRQEIRRGVPLIVSLHEGEHWAAVYGYSPGKIYVADSLIAPTVKWSTQEFTYYWDRWAAKVEPA